MSAADGLAWNEEDAGAIPATLTIFRKAGRYKLAAPVLKTGSVSPEVGALPTPSANQPSTTNCNHELNHPIAQMAGAKIRPAQTAAPCASSAQATAIAQNLAVAGAAHRPFSGRRQPARIPHPMAAVSPLTKPRERKSHETCHPLPRPVALSP
jgi:hypothetical protein